MPEPTNTQTVSTVSMSDTSGTSELSCVVPGREPADPPGNATTPRADRPGASWWCLVVLGSGGYSAGVGSSVGVSSAGVSSVVGSSVGVSSVVGSSVGVSSAVGSSDGTGISA